MAEVAVTIRGQLYDLYNRTTQQVVLQGQASLTGLTVGGGPIYPEGPGEVPPGGDAHPEHPIYYPPYPAHPIAPGGPYPEHPIFYPPGSGPSEPRPEHPIVLPPDPPTEPPTEPPTNPPNPQWVWGFNPTLNRWLRVYVPGPGQPGPK